MFEKHQFLLEGLTQALPIFVTPEDKALLAHVHLDHYLQLVRAELHVAINEGVSATECAARARSLVPFWNGEDIADGISQTLMFDQAAQRAGFFSRASRLAPPLCLAFNLHADLGRLRGCPYRPP